MEHFEELLNRPTPVNPPDIPLAEEVLQINWERSSKVEIRKAIYLLKRGKASGPDEILAEVIQADTEASTEMLHNLIGKNMGQRKNTNRMERRVPRQDPKERRLQECKNCRGILPLSVPGKVLNSHLKKTVVDARLRDHQNASEKIDLASTKS